jgi:hypothetical protein
MEIQWLPLGKSLADKHRAAELRWRGMPPGIPPEMAIEFMEKLKAVAPFESSQAAGNSWVPQWSVTIDSKGIASYTRNGQPARGRFQMQTGARERVRVVAA